ncbi:MAG TPA: TolC family protein, partial [Desulfosarcina sp.]|nr:TolC family protein [Desulfosarcina sp.]
MKRLPTAFAAFVLSVAADTGYGGYRDLKRELDAYEPPAMLYQQGTARLPAGGGEDDFEAARQIIQAARERWEQLASRRPTAVLGDGDIAPAPADASLDDDRALALLRPRFSLLTVQSLILLRSPSVKGAEDRFQAALEGFDQVTQLDEILRRYSAYTAAVMPGVGPMRGMGDTIQMKFPFPGVTALKGQVAEQNVAAAKHEMDMVRRDTVAQGTKAYWNLLYAHRALEVTRDTLHRLNHLESVATTRYGAGKTSYQDVIKIRIGREKLEDQLNT